MAETAQPFDSQPGMRPEASAWIMLVGFFALFCTIVAVLGIAGWRYYTSATIAIDGSLLRSHVNAGVVIQSRGQLVGTSIERLPAESDPCPGEADICSPVNEGDSIKTKPEAGYGPVASLILPDTSQIDFWAHPAGGDLVIESIRGSAWTYEHQEVRLQQIAGYVRYDIADTQPYADVDYLVDLGNGILVQLAPGGSYSINMPQPHEQSLQPVTTNGLPLYAEVAVRDAGRAIIENGGRRISLAPDQLVQITADGSLSMPQPAAWQLIADADFEQFDEQNQYNTGSLTWRRAWNWDVPNMTDAEKNGRFMVVRGCRPETPDLCTPEEQVNIGQFRRDGGQTRPFTVGIEQTLDVDVSEFRSLRLTGWVRVLTQTVALTGIAGSECPMMIQLVYKLTSPTDQQENRYFCMYTTTDPKLAIPQDVGQIRYRSVPLFQWYRLDVELRDDSLMQQARYIQQVRVEARGHDYLVEFSGLSLTGIQ
mgnify:CR=1 FL=1